MWNTDSIPKATIPPFPTTSIAGNQSGSSGIYVMIPTEMSNTDWPVFPQAGGLVAASNTHENNGSHVPALEATTTGFLADPLAVQVYTCGLVGGLHCNLPLRGSVESIRLHLRVHGPRYAQRQVVQCPWIGCSDTLQWRNIPRHVQSNHLGVRYKCLGCNRLFTRPEGLARHTASVLRRYEGIEGAGEPN